MADSVEMVKMPNVHYRDAAQRVFDNAAFVTEVGLLLVQIDAGSVLTELPVLVRHQQQTGTVHAGVLATMADHTAGTAATTILHENEYVLSAAINLNLLRPAGGERLYCRATVLKPGRRLVVAESEVYAEKDGRRILVAKATVTLAVLKATAPAE